MHYVFECVSLTLDVWKLHYSTFIFGVIQLSIVFCELLVRSFSKLLAVGSRFFCVFGAGVRIRSLVPSFQLKSKTKMWFNLSAKVREKLSSYVLTVVDYNWNILIS